MLTCDGGSVYSKNALTTYIVCVSFDNPQWKSIAGTSSSYWVEHKSFRNKQ